MTADTKEHKIGETSFKISKNSDSPMKPCAVQKVSIPAAETGKSYTFSAYVKQNSDDVSEGVAEIFITPFKDAEKLSEPARKEISGLQKGKWTKVFVTMDVPKGTDVLEVGFGLVKSNCTVYFDCLQLEEGDVANDYNLLENSGFDKELSYWKASGFGENDGVIGGRLCINGDISTRKSASQTVKINMKNPVFCVNARAEAQSLPLTERDGKTAGFNVSLDFLYEDNSHDTKIIKFNPEILSKQSICDSAQAGNGSFKDKIVKSVTVSLNYDHNENSASFDDIQLSLDDAGSRYSYDESGNIESILDPSDNQTLVEMTENNEIHSITSPKGYASTIEYSSKNPHIPIKSTNPLPGKQLLMTSYEYDRFHNVTKVVASLVGQSSRTIEQNFSYTSDGNYPKSITDVFGNTVRYSYNQRNGDLTSVTDAKGNIVHYEYDRVGRLVKTKNNSSVYGTKYKNGAVSSIFHNNDEQSNVVYNFSYDDFGNIDKISVGDQALTENTYDAHNGLLRKSTYGNGDSVLFDYDKYERLVGKTCTKSQGESKE